MTGEYISRSQLLLQYYAALAELEKEERVMAAGAGAGFGFEPPVERVRQPLLLQKEVRITL